MDGVWQLVWRKDGEVELLEGPRPQFQRHSWRVRPDSKEIKHSRFSSCFNLASEEEQGFEELRVSCPVQAETEKQLHVLNFEVLGTHLDERADRPRSEMV